LFKDRVLRRILGPNRDEVTGEWRKLHNEELHNLYSSPHIIKQIKSWRMMCVVHVALMVEERKVSKVWWETLKERDYLEDRHRWEDGIRMGLKETGLGVCGVDSVHSA
jgi:hypothetical protein